MAMDEGRIGLVISILVLGLAGAIWARKQMMLRRAQGWPIAQGQVVATDILFHQNSGQPAASRYVAEITYSYTAQGENFRGRFQRAFLRRVSAEAWTGHYRKGQHLVVRYDPKDLKLSTFFESEQLKAAATA